MWLYLPTSCRSAQEVEDSTSGLDLLYQTLEQSATWKTKSRRARSWRTIWKKAGWTTRLFGQTYEPLTAQRGAESWITSLADTRASRSATPAVASEQPTPGTSGLTCDESWERFSREYASSRTSALICDLDSTRSPETFKAWATRLRQACLQRRKSALRTAANVFSSWPTATSSMTTGAGTQGRDGGLNLQTAASAWPTPDAAQGGRVQSAEAKAAGKKAQIGLDNLARIWQTPATFQGKYRRQVNQTERAEELLPAQAKSVTAWWATPTSRDHKDSGENVNYEKVAAKSKLSGQSVLATEAWATPVASDDGKKVTPASLQPGLIGQSSKFAGRLDQETTGRLSLNAYGRPRLNPRFVEWLMGWPEGWVTIGYLALTSSTSSATE